MECPQCGSEMWDNTVDKKNPKGPDYKCKDKTCNHAIWLPKDATHRQDAPKSRVNAPNLSPKPTNGVSTSTEMMRLAYRKDLMLCLINKFGDTATSADVVGMFELYWKEIEK